METRKDEVGSLTANEKFEQEMFSYFDLNLLRILLL